MGQHEPAWRPSCAVLLFLAVLTVPSLAEYSSLWDALSGEKLVTLTTLINLAKQKEQFDDPGFAVTMFAPRNAALASVVAKLAVNNIRDFDEIKNQAQTILTYHIIPVTGVNFTDNLNMPSVLSFNAQPNMTTLMTFRVLDTDTRYVGGKIPGATFRIVDKIQANKSDLYIIDDVLYPPSDMFNTPLSIPARIAGDSRLTILNTLINNDTVLLNILKNPLLAVTFFAPTDDAFNAFFKASGESVDSLLGTPLLSRVLRNHVIPARPLILNTWPDQTLVFASASDVTTDLLTVTKSTRTRLLVFKTVEFTVKGSGNSGDPIYVIDNDNAAAMSSVQIINGVILPDLSQTSTTKTGTRRRMLGHKGVRTHRKVGQVAV